MSRTRRAWRSFRRTDRVLYCVGYDRSAGLSMREVYVDGLAAFLSRREAFCGRFVYTSSTGVYGQDDGSWVDENSPTEPATDSGRVCLEAEWLLPLTPRRGDRAVRGPVRAGPDLAAGQPGARRADSRRSRPLAEPAFTSRTPRGSRWRRSIIRDRGGCTSPPTTVPCPAGSSTKRSPAFLRLPPPRFLTPRSSRASAGAMRRASASATRRIKAELGVGCLYPDIRVGIPAALGEGQARPVGPQSIGAGSM